ncbi:unnamed protein product [Vitrella brassicaformis CCMP3155]|uniref:Uncharacterized protein n=2 Tax=Vitrella brassicaformis TaxID=1169539 RepID=A0A0G4G1A8_VITBC|nr:unnamed protein product [Vitrella brassicaformis CCMP3155]|eukprot:CEM21273.1 unnamed protein product [Vitrella brassicaformis CCMP3155]
MDSRSPGQTKRLFRLPSLPLPTAHRHKPFRRLPSSALLQWQASDLERLLDLRCGPPGSTTVWWYGGSLTNVMTGRVLADVEGAELSYAAEFSHSPSHAHSSLSANSDATARGVQLCRKAFVYLQPGKRQLMESFRWTPTSPARRLKRPVHAYSQAISHVLRNGTLALMADLPDGRTVTVGEAGGRLSGPAATGLGGGVGDRGRESRYGSREDPGSPCYLQLTVRLPGLSQKGRWWGQQQQQHQAVDTAAAAADQLRASEARERWRQWVQIGPSRPRQATCVESYCYTRQRRGRRTPLINLLLSRMHLQRSPSEDADVTLTYSRTGACPAWCGRGVCRLDLHGSRLSSPDSLPAHLRDAIQSVDSTFFSDPLPTSRDAFLEASRQRAEAVRAARRRGGMRERVRRDVSEGWEGFRAGIGRLAELVR